VSEEHKRFCGKTFLSGRKAASDSDADAEARRRTDPSCAHTERDPTTTLGTLGISSHQPDNFSDLHQNQD